MPLDISAISEQVSRMSDEFVSLDREARSKEAYDQLRSQDPDDLRAKLDAPGFGTSWVVARPVDTLVNTCLVPRRPSSLSVVAADGSSIAPDRHNPVRYYVIKTGSVLLTYGVEPDAHLTAQGHLFCEETDQYIPHDHKTIPVEGSRLGIKMALLALEALLEIAQAGPTTTRSSHCGMDH